MTGMDRIKDKILEDARLKAGAILEQAEQEVRNIMDQASEEAEQKRAELLEKANADGEQTYRRMLAVAGLEGRKKLLGAKQEMIDAAFAKAMEKVTGLPDRQYQELLERMIAEAAAGYREPSEQAGGTDIPQERFSGEVMLSEKDAARMDGQFIVNINKRLSASGKKGTITLSEKRIRAAGGFILKIGDMEINSTFEILFEMLRTQLESDVVSILFGS
ncbi:MAG: V-type ATP synthase subunit E [Clostridiaceae bacterium]|jgi:V/A-type H+-transporting ATPase subunit E|nr:V-type ATP synthase subunit E [Clostridiaceae bacterium]